MHNEIISFFASCIDIQLRLGVQLNTDFTAGKFLPIEDKLSASASFNTPVATDNDGSVSANRNITTTTATAYIDDSIEKIFQDIEAFDGCMLKKYATRTVCGDGQHNAKIMLIGEAPGEEEDERGIPFCGKSGRLLEKALAFIGLHRSKNLFITNTVFWRPINNRKPSQQEIEMCSIFIHRMINVMQPKLIILCGSTSVSALLGNFNIKMLDVVGKLHQYDQNIQMFPIYHPSYLLRNPISKRATWQHLLEIKKHFANFIK